MIFGRDHSTTREPDPYADLLTNHAATVSVAARMGLISAADISHKSFELAVIYDNAVADRDRRNREKGKSGGGGAGAKVKHTSGAKGLRSFMAMAQKTKQGEGG